MSFSKTLRFSLLLCLVASFLLTFAASSLRPLQEENKRIDRQKNVLKALGLLEIDRKYEMAEIDELYSKSVALKYVSKTGELLATKTENAAPVFLYSKDGKLEASVTVDMMDFALDGPWASIHETCKALHTGADGVAKTWTEVMLKVTADVAKICK